MSEPKPKRIYVTSRGYYPHDIVNWSIPVRPETTDAQMESIMWAMDEIQTAEMIWGWRKPRMTPIEQSARQDSLSLLRWTIWWQNHCEYQSQYNINKTAWIPHRNLAWISIPFADPKQSRYTVEWMKVNRIKKLSDYKPMTDATWLRVFDAFAQHVWLGGHYENEQPTLYSQITEIHFKASHPTQFVKNITKV